MQCVRKRDGSVVAFNRRNIVNVLAAAGQASGEFDATLAETLADLVLARLADESCPEVETIQDRVEETLAQTGWWRTARAYVVYREQRAPWLTWKAA